MKTKILLLLISSFFIGFISYSQTFEEFKKQQQDGLEAMKKQQEEFIKKMQGEFNEYVKQRDKEFADYLKNQWKEFEAVEGEEPPEKPKPDEIPAYEEVPDRVETWAKVPAIVPTIDINPEKEKQVVVPQIRKSDEQSFDKAKMAFDFFGFKIILDYDQQFKFEPPAAINPGTISGFWEKMSGTNYSGLIAELEMYKTQMNLNDWAYYLLVDEFSKNLYAGSDNGQNLMKWFMLNRSGYKSKLAYANNKVSLLVPSIYTVYSKSYLNIQNQNYYVMRDLGAMDIFTYEKDYPGAGKLIDFSIKSPLNFDKKIVNKSLGFVYKDKPYSLNISYNQNLIDFYKDYPQVNINIYFDAAVSPETKESLLESLRPVVNTMSETEAVGFLLKFVQTSFNYKTDQQQFAHEKFFFPEEILYYPYSDCEDRSVFFAYLVNELLNLKVVGLEYTGHIATAVNFSAPIEGDYVMYHDEKYTIADATFINAPIGLTMPEYRKKEMKIIELANFRNTGRSYKTFWERAEESGGFRGNNLQDIVFDEEGNAYLTGYFTGEANFGSTVLSNSENSGKRNFFIVSYSPQGKLNWAKMARSSDNATGYSIAIDNNNDLYVAGSFNGKLTFENGLAEIQCKEAINDVFVAKYNVAGRFVWARKSGLDTYPQENYLTYLTKFGKDGTNKGTSFYGEDQNFKNFGLQLGPMNMLYITGAFNNTSGFALAKNELVTNESGTFDLLSSLKEESDKLILENYEQHIAGLFSVLNHVKYSGIKLAGEDAQKALNKYNPVFKKEYPSVYESIGRINFLVNDDGIITLETINGKSMSIDKLRIDNESKIKITSYSTGDAQIDIMSGISVGKLMIWFDLNYVKLFKKSGDLLFDYDSDHTQKVLNLKQDLLY
ncbi:MAG: hypothetical protein K9G76_01760 [Bacteroidales bacterium]|nr:hypothetical protein [Bacteroidales bacterium]MCF8403280.1 hypothetical protein [Bacteroidales bacterium]